MITVKMLRQIAIAGFFMAGLYLIIHVATFFRISLTSFFSIFWSGILYVLTFNLVFLLYTRDLDQTERQSTKELLAPLPKWVQVSLRLLYVYCIVILLSNFVREGGLVSEIFGNYFVLDKAFYSFFEQDLLMVRIGSAIYMLIYLLISSLFWYAKDGICPMELFKRLQNRGE